MYWKLKNKKKPKQEKVLKMLFPSFLSPCSYEKTILNQSLGQEPCFIQARLPFLQASSTRWHGLWSRPPELPRTHCNSLNSWREPDGGASHVPESSAEQFTDWGCHIKNLSPPGALAWFREHKRMDRFGSKWAQLKQCMWLIPFFFTAPVALLQQQQLFRDSWRISVFTIIFSLSCNHSTLFASCSQWALKFSYSQFLTLFQQETPVDVYSLPRCLLLFYWLTKSEPQDEFFFPSICF